MISTLKKKLNKKGFTLAELLVVVAIIAVLVAISIPIFSGQLAKAKESTDAANIRAAYAEAAAESLLADGSTASVTSEPMTDTRTTWTYVKTKIGGTALPATTKDKGIVVKVNSDGTVEFSIAS